MTQIINMSINNNCYPDDLKLAEVSPVFKKDDLDKGNYRPVSVTFYVSKVFERIMYQQIDLMKDRLSNLLTGFRKNHNTQHFLMSMLERWKKKRRTKVVYVQYLWICQRPFTHWITYY